MLLIAILLFWGGTALSASDSMIVDLSSGRWRAFLPNRSIEVNGTVPGSIYTDLYAAGVLNQGPLLYRFNDLDYRWVSYNDWTYSLQFDVTSDQLRYLAVDLVFYGVDTVSTVWLNGVQIGATDNMFVRYKFPAKPLLQVGPNELEVRFLSPVLYARQQYELQALDHPVLPAALDPAYQGEDHANHIRKMQSSFSWDWGPAFPTMGLWHKVQLEADNTCTIRDFRVQTTRNADRSWNVKLLFHFETADVGVVHTGTVDIRIWNQNSMQLLLDESVAISVTGDGDREGSTEQFEFTVAESLVDPWMPNGYGNQTLYEIRLGYTETGSPFQPKVLYDRIGFRTVQLVQDEIPGGRNFFVRINDEPVFLAGSNWIPAQPLPELYTPEYVRELLTSAREANMNSLRIWGGGIFEFDEFYRVADELGITIWHDFMFACSMYPANEAFLANVRTEIRQQVRRLQRHPSIILWAGNNENEVALRQNWYGTQSNFAVYKADYIALYVDTIRTLVAQEDPSRPYAVSSPSNGIRSEEEGYIAETPGSELYGDVHYYNYLGDSWDWRTYPKPRMATEYGFQALPSVHAWAEAAAPIGTNDDWHYDGQLLDKRQHHPKGNEELLFQVNQRLGSPRNSSAEQLFIDMIYLTQMHQAESIKIETEHYRRLQFMTIDGLGGTMGALYWQLNDIWQGPSWASLENGGRWKPLHHFAVKFFAPVSFSFWQVADDIDVFAHWFRQVDFRPGTLQVQLFTWSKLEPLLTDRVAVNDAVPGIPLWRKPLSSWLAENNCTRQTCLLSGRYVDDDDQSLAPDSYYFFDDFPAVSNLQKANVQLGPVVVIDPSTIQVTVSTDHLAAFVWLDSAIDRPGRFSDNGFLLTTATRTVTFRPREPFTSSQEANQFVDNLRVTHLAQIIR